MGTDKFAIYTLYIEFVGVCTWLSSFRIHLSSQGTVSSTMIRVFGSRWLVYNEDCGLRYVWTMSVNCSFLSRSAWGVQWLVCCKMSCFFSPSWCLLWRMGGDACVSRWMFIICPSSNMWASSLETKLWRHLYLHWLRIKVVCFGCLWGTIGRYWWVNTTVL